VSPTEKAESLFRLARSTGSPAERASALARAREIVTKHHLLVTSEGRVIERPPPAKPPPSPSRRPSLSAWWDDVAPRAKRFLEAVVASSEAERERATQKAAERRAQRRWDLRDVGEEPPRRRH